MAVIAFYDADITKYGAGLFNLELMKAVTYHRNRRDIAVISDSLKTHAYSKLYFRKDYNDGDFPMELYNDPKIEYGGRAFSPSRYKPLPIDIERSLPDPEIYRRHEKRFQQYNYQKTAFHRYIQNTQHLRLSLDGETIWRDYRVPVDMTSDRRNLIFHDYNLNNIKHALMAIEDLVDVPWKNPVRIGVKYPISTYNFDELLSWLEVPWIIEDFKLEYKGLLKDEQVVELIAKMKEKQRGTAEVYQNISYGIKNEKEFFDKYAIQTYYQVIYAKNQQVRLYFTTNPNFFTSPYMENYFPLLRHFVKVERKLHSYARLNPNWAKREILNSTLYYYAQSYVKNKEIVQAENVKKMRGVFHYMKDKHYELFDKFYQTTHVKLIGGNFKDVTKRGN